MELRVPSPLELSGSLSENWKRFKESYKNYSIGYELDAKSDAVQVAIFKNIVGEEACELLNTLNLSEAQSSKVSNIIQAIDSYIKPKKNLVYSRFLFNSRCQQESEEFEASFLSVKKLADNCDFGTLKAELSRDRLVVGINNKTVQERLLGEEFDLDKVVKICRSVETGKQRANEVSNGNQVHYIKYQPTTFTPTNMATRMG
ncbi:uncharacterized protein [Bemisia tabaci]|uniref:uncharacterized protein n=1 Tax=Bemisia tabaci TaxID=7038 RepID=UPI003B27B5A5